MRRRRSPRCDARARSGRLTRRCSGGSACTCRRPASSKRPFRCSRARPRVPIRASTRSTRWGLRTTGQAGRRTLWRRSRGSRRSTCETRWPGRMRARRTSTPGTPRPRAARSASRSRRTRSGPRATRASAWSNWRGTTGRVRSRPGDGRCELNPREFDALFNLATELINGRQNDAARPYVQQFVDDRAAGGLREGHREAARLARLWWKVARVFRPAIRTRRHH